MLALGFTPSLTLHSSAQASEPQAQAQKANASANASLRFNRDIRPLLSDNCMSCHGPDPGSRKAGLRLDTKEGLYESTPKRGPAVVPGQPEKSELWKRIITTDPDDVMPPPKSHKELKPAQRELIRQWIAGGANWEPHWSFIAPERPQIPTASAANHTWVRNPIDAFVLAKLESHGLTPALEADRRTLARRLSLDLTGLPPTPEQVEAFVKDRSPQYYETFVDALMASPHWGEHRGRYWLDAARYADTHGLHFDNYREIWPYRDWVIRAFNRNQPFDQFTLEQLAGDLIPDATQDQKVATGFQRCNATTNEGGTIEDENLANYANDRVSTMSWVWLGLTANCAACHDHKFDPVTMKDFYSMAAFFRNTKQSGFDRNRRESDVSIVAPQTAKDQQRWVSLPEELKSLQEKLDKATDQGRVRFTNWLATAKPSDLSGAVKLPGSYLDLALNEGRGKTVRGKVEGKTMRFNLGSNATWRAGGPLGTGLVLNEGNTLDLGGLADFDRFQPFSVGAWIHVPTNYSGNWTLLGRVIGDKDRGSRYAGWDLALQDGYLSLVMTRTWSSSALKTRVSEKRIATNQWVHVFATYDGSARSGGVKLYLNGQLQKLSGDLDNLEGTIRVRTPLRVGRRDYGDVCKGLAIQDLKIYQRELDSNEVGALAWGAQAGAILAKKPADRSEAENHGLYSTYLMTREEGWTKLMRGHLALRGEKQAIYGRSPVAHIQVEKTNSVPMAQVLFRGQYDKPKEKVGPATFASLNPMPKGAPPNRLGLSQWLTAPENPLMARVTVNRFWQELFGTGFVKTSEDFGIMGDIPTHPELLDWLAVEFRESKWDVKHLFRLMVTSATYRQASVATAEKLEKDPANRWMSRGPRFRMDAEMVRDYALAASGLLVPKIGGPSVKPYQPPGVWEAVAMPESNTRYYLQDHGEALYRRSLYTFWKRAAPPATLDLFNAPSRETCAVRRERTNTPLQALATLNDPQFVEAARHLASESIRRGGGRTEKIIQDMALRLLARTLSQQELGIVTDSFRDYLEYYKSQPEAAKQLVEVGDSDPGRVRSFPQLAAMTMVANNLMNLDEVLNK